MKMTQQKNENLVQVQQQCSVYCCIKTIFESWLFWLIWPFKCQILMILTMAKYHENLLRDSSLSLLSIVNFFSSLETKMILKIPNETFPETPYIWTMSLLLYCHPPRRLFAHLFSNFVHQHYPARASISHGFFVHFHV